MNPHGKPDPAQPVVRQIGRAGNDADFGGVGMAP
jgi:hypothetical protein